MRSIQKLPRVKHTQRGTALVMTLVILLLLTMLGITAINTSTLEERMAGNTKDQNLSFQAAETALRAAEAWVQSTTAATALNTNNAIGIYDPANPLVTPVEVWDSVDWSSTKVVEYPGTPGTAGSGGLTEVNTQPKYIIEKVNTEPLSPGTRITVRITARGTGASDTTVSMVQSTYTVTYP